MVKQRRVVTVSGEDGYISLTEPELKAYQVEVYFSATNINNVNYFNFEWYPRQTLYGRFAFARGQYIIKTHLIKYQNELIYTEIATLNETVRRMQCIYRRQYDLEVTMLNVLLAIVEGLDVTSPPVSPDLIPPQPIAIPGLQLDGIYYQMQPGCAGQLTIDTWVDDDTCVDLDGNPLTQDGHGNPPDPAKSGDPESGDANDVPPPDYSPGSQPIAKPPSEFDPSQNLPNPGALQGQACTMYHVSYYPTIDGTAGATQTITLPGKIGAPGSQQAIGANGQPIPGSISYYIPYGIGCNESGKTEGKVGLVTAGSQTQVTLTIVSITPV